MGKGKATSLKKRDRAVALGRWTEKLRKTLPLAEAIEAIEERRRRANSDDSYTLALEVVHLLIAAGRELEADRIVNEMIARLPDDVRFCSSSLEAIQASDTILILTEWDEFKDESLYSGKVVIDGRRALDPSRARNCCDYEGLY